MDTYGWDTAAVVRTESLNEVLAAKWDSQPHTFTADPQTDPPILVTGEFGSCRIVPGGAGELVHLAMEIKAGVLAIGAGTPPPAELLALIGRSASMHGSRQDFDIAGVAVVVEINLILVGDPQSPEQLLQFQLDKPGTEQPAPGPGYVTPVKVLDPGGTLSTKEKTLLGFAIATSMIGDSSLTSYVLGSINPIVTSSDLWLSPTQSTYAYSARELSGSGMLGILSTTDGRTRQALPALIDPSVLDDTAALGFIVSQDLVLEHVLKPSLPAVYDTMLDSFRMDRPTHRIRLNHSFRTFPVKSGLITYHPEITRFEMGIDGNRIRTKLGGICDMHAGIEMTFSIEVANAARYDHTAGTIMFDRDSTPQTSHSASIPWYLAYLSPIVALITDICASEISDSIAHQLTESARSALSIVQSPPKLTSWVGIEGFEVTAAGLDTSLFLTGRPRSVATSAS
jgi:hypothetical protein